MYKPDIKEYSEYATLLLTLDNSKEEYSKKFGISVSRPMKLYGPFFDDYDTKVNDICPWNTDKFKGMPYDSFKFNNSVNIDFEYIDESFLSMPEDYRVVYFSEDKINLNDVRFSEGPSCIYLEWTIKSDDEKIVHLRVGNNELFKLWLNGEKILESHKQNTWMPCNFMKNLTLSKGTNKVIIKLIKWSSDFEFSIGLADELKSERFTEFLYNIITIID